MTLIGKFKKQGAPAAAAPEQPAQPAAPAGGNFKRRGGAAGGPQKSRYEGYTGGTERTPMLNAGDYILEVLGSELIPTQNLQKPGRTTWMCHVRVVESEGPEATPVGEERGIVCLQDTAGGRADYFRCCRAIAGFTTDEEFAAWCKECGSTPGFFLQATEGDITPFSPNGENPIEGAKFGATVSKGKDDGKGSYFRQYFFAPVDES